MRVIRLFARVFIDIIGYFEGIPGAESQKSDFNSIPMPGPVVQMVLLMPQKGNDYCAAPGCRTGCFLFFQYFFKISHRTKQQISSEKHVPDQIQLYIPDCFFEILMSGDSTFHHLGSLRFGP